MRQVQIRAHHDNRPAPFSSQDQAKNSHSTFPPSLKATAGKQLILSTLNFLLIFAPPPSSKTSVGKLMANDPSYAKASEDRPQTFNSLMANDQENLLKKV